MDAVTPHDILTGAAVLLGEREWCQGALTKDDEGKANFGHPDSPALSLLGAMFLSAGLRDYFGPVDNWGWALGDEEWAWKAALECVREVTGDRYVTDWNDAPGRTGPEVVEVLREAAEAALRNAAWQHFMDYRP